jgi:DNA-binding winged helix-turn-helix (wHTH) protein/tetratricopeptide (TPR) repeat protein
MILEFAEWELDLRHGELRRAGAPADVARKPLDLLLYLARHRDRTVPHDELLREVWPEGGISEMALSTALRDIRRVLGDDGRKQAVLRTQRGRGIRFVAEAEERAPERRSEPSALVGRGDALARLGNVLDDVAVGRRSTVLLTGEAGIGKTRLARELAELAEARGFRTVLARCWDAEASPAFWPWIGVLRALLGDTSPGRLRERLGEGAAWIAPLLPELVPEMHAQESGSRLPTYSAANALLVSLTRARPLLVVLDDVQQADIASLELLQYLSLEQQPASLLLAATWRDGEPPEGDPRTAVLSSLAGSDRVESLPLEGLTVPETGELIAPLAGHEPEPAFVASLHERTRGNPFYLKETTRHLAASRPPEDRSERWTQTISQESTDVPLSLRRMIRRRTEALGADCRALLEVASVFDHEVPLALLEAVGSLTECDVPKLVDRALEAHLLEETPDRREHFHFAHPILREAVYAGIQVARRRALHLEVGEAIERHLSDRDEAPWAALARHFTAAGPGHSLEAARFGADAARAALTRSAWEDAAEHCERSLRLLDRRQDEPQARERCALLIELARARRLALRLPEASEKSVEALDLARRLDDPVVFGRAALEWELVRWMAEGTGSFSARVSNLEARLSTLEQALEALGEADLSLRALLLSQQAKTGTAAGRNMERAGTEAVLAARRTMDPATLAACLGGSWWAHWRPQHLARRAEILEEMQAIDRQSPGLSSGELGYYGRRCEFRFVDSLRAGDLRGASQALREAEQVPSDSFCRAARVLLDGQLDLLQGRTEAAEAKARSGLAEGQESSSGNLITGGVYLLAMVHWLRGSLSELPLERDNPVTPFVELLQGESEDVLASLDRLIHWVGELADPVESNLLPLLVESCARFGASPAIPALEARISAYTPQHLVGTAGRYSGSSLHWLGVLKATAGRHDEALELFGRAAEAYERLQAVPWIAKLQWAQASSLEAAGGDREAVAKLRREATETAERLGIRL